jgi:hypothetical protein
LTASSGSAEGRPAPIFRGPQVPSPAPTHHYAGIVTKLHPLAPREARTFRRRAFSGRASCDPVSPDLHGEDCSRPQRCSGAGMRGRGSRSPLGSASAPTLSPISWLIPTPHTIAVYTDDHATLATRRPAPALPGPDFHWLDRTSLAWRTHFLTLMRHWTWASRNRCPRALLPVARRLTNSLFLSQS